ncbi:hypothetical protein [Limnohabitans sp.]|uniref:hypothetical protein n=1 Tax=Limnohabitans sp. TaxID=1907725 RepID=UPI0037C0E692
MPLGDSALIWTLHPGPHPQHRGSSRGELVRDALRLPVVADWEHGEFSMRARSLPEMAQI